MYEDKTYDNLLAEGKALISDSILKNEGSLVHNALSIIAYELERFYIQADYLMEQISPANADYDNLVTLCKQRGIYPEDASAAIVKIIADADVPVGARFSLNIFNYTVTEVIEGEEHTYRATCETAGTAPNTIKGRLTPITYIAGLTSAEITEVLVEGEDATTQEELLEKYTNSFVNEAFGGNVTEYKAQVSRIDGVSGCKVFPAWNGGGTVKVVAISASYNTISDELVQTIQDALCPAASSGKGYGIAPIGHNVTVASVIGKPVNISTSITYASGQSWDTIGDKITAAIEDYFLELRKAWDEGSESEFVTAYVSRTEAHMLEVAGVLDVSGTTLNGNSAKLELAWDEIPILGEIAHD